MNGRAHCRSLILQHRQKGTVAAAKTPPARTRRTERRGRLVSASAVSRHGTLQVRHRQLPERHHRPDHAPKQSTHGSESADATDDRKCRTDQSARRRLEPIRTPLAETTRQMMNAQGTKTLNFIGFASSVSSLEVRAVSPLGTASAATGLMYKSLRV